MPPQSNSPLRHLGGFFIERPEYWTQGLDNWCEDYERRLQTLLSAMKYQEDKAIEQGWLKSTQWLSSPMHDSLKSGDFWITYAARNNFAFDLIYWHMIDQRFFGPMSSPIDNVWRQRFDFLEPEERADIENLVAIKLQEMKTRALAWDPDDYTKELTENASEDNAAKENEDGQTGATVEDNKEVVSDKIAW